MTFNAVIASFDISIQLLPVGFTALDRGAHDHGLMAFKQ